MARKAYGAFLLLLVILSLFAVGVWFHSHLDGWEHTWSDPENQQGGRIVSSRGQLIFQHCDLKPLPVTLENPILKKGTKAEMPKDFTVGSNGEGERTMITISGFPIPFARPDTGTFIAWSSDSKFNVQSTQQTGAETKGHWWYSRWHEWVIAYWLATLLLILLPLSEGIRWLYRRRKWEAGGSPGVAG